MITWLFTQVWLWSLASFALGALLTWLLFVRPARRRLEHALAELSRHYGYYDRPVYDDPDYDRGDFDGRGYDEYVEQDTAEQGDVYAYDGRAHEEPERPLDLLTEPPTIAPRAYVAAPESAPEPGNEPTVAEFERDPQPAWVPAEVPPQPEPASTSSTWFHRSGEELGAESPDTDPAVTAVQPSVTDAEPETAATEGSRGEQRDDLSGQLRSLFAPVEGGNPAGETGYIPPVGADATAVLPKVPSEDHEPKHAQVSGDLHVPGEPEDELPRRTPSHTGEAPQAEPPHIPEALWRRVGASKPHSTAPDEPGTGGPANIQPGENLDEDSNLPRRTPGAHPHPGQGFASNGPMIKGHSATRQYHSPDSPQYDDIVADVWFRTPADAETAGFAPWHGGRG